MENKLINFAYTDEYKKYTDQYESIFNAEYFKKKETVNLNEEYKVEILHYNHTYQMMENYWCKIDCQEIVLYDDSESIVYKSRYEFGSVFYSLIKHSNGNLYFITGHDLQKYSVYNISNNTETKYACECHINEDSKEDCYSDFMMVDDIIYNPHNNMLAINGILQYLKIPTVSLGIFDTPDDLPFRAKNLYNFMEKKIGNSACQAISWTEENTLVLYNDELDINTTIDQIEILDIFNS